jgi:hypothetical protein
VAGNESAAMILQVVVVPSIFFTGVISQKRENKKQKKIQNDVHCKVFNHHR